MIDLHTHTQYSDGTWSLQKLLLEAQKAGLEILSITDHDTVKAYRELEGRHDETIFSGRIIPGVELSTVYDGIAFHMLAYDFDYKKLEPWIYEHYELHKPNLKDEFDYMVKSCKKNGIKIGKLMYEEEKGWPIDVIFPEIKKFPENRKFFKEEEWNDVDVFFNSCITNKHFPVFVDFSIHFPLASLVADAVRKAGGKLFIAHLYKYHLEEPFRFLDLLRECDVIDGVEVEHSTFTPAQSEELKKYCLQHNLLMCGGTDCHGEKKKDRKLGVGYGNMHVNSRLLENW